MTQGLSPRGRGKPRIPRRPIGRRGSIPAWAGETCVRLPAGLTDEVYPRVGGGNECLEKSGYSLFGLSPRGRGKPGAVAIIANFAWSIPAWAGETTKPLTALQGLRVYPRVGGGNVSASPLLLRLLGLSPRGRGKRHIWLLSGGGSGSIPAWAGETRVIAPLRYMCLVYPRVGGGNAMALSDARKFGGLSPRGRGKPGTGVAAVKSCRSIPAWAGETQDTRRRRPA